MKPKIKKLLIFGGIACVVITIVAVIIIHIINGDGGSGIIQDGEVENNLGDFKPEYGTFKFSGSYNDKVDTELQYAYSDKYFTIDSTIYNASLATMSLCLELSSWSSGETEVWNEKSKNAKDLLTKIGFTDFAQNDFWQEKPSKDSIGAVAARKQMEDSTLIALAVRGGGYYSEWGSNVMVGNSEEHTGFSQGRDNVVKFLNDYIKSNNIEGKVKVWLVGFSRGGAVANMIAGYLNKNGLSGNVTLDFKDLYCYTFEAPQGALPKTAGTDEEHANIHNVVNANDLVTLVAPNAWDFVRYNTTSRLLPTITTKGFEAAYETMLKEYEKIIDVSPLEDKSEAEYKISEYAKKLQVSVDILSFLPTGDPFISIDVVDDTTMSQAEMLNNSITALINAVQSRDNYNANAESDIALLLDKLLQYGNDNTIDELIGSLGQALTENDYENLIYVVAPIFEIGTTSLDERKEEVIKRLHEVVPQPEGFEDLYGSLSVIIEALGTMLINDTEELCDLILSFTSTSLLQVHNPEIIMAWLRAGDPHYTDTPYTNTVPEALRQVLINCPVDIKVYDSKGTLVAEVINKVAKTYNAVVGCGIDSRGEIVIHLPSDEEYDIEIIATDNGHVNVNVSENNIVHSKITLSQNYQDIPVIKGDTLKVDVPVMKTEEYTDVEQDGSTVEYKITGTGGDVIEPNSKTTGDNIKYYKVDAEYDNNYGLIIGGGQYLAGSFEQLEAQPVAGSEFVGYYIDDVLVSSETIYRFEVTNDMKVVAKFKEVDMYQLEYKVTGNGTVSNVDAKYSEGTLVLLEAKADNGYIFDHWEATAGTIADINAKDTNIIVGSSDAVITAVFRERTADDVVLCDKCNKELGIDESHNATCGNSKHFTCDGSNHDAGDCGIDGHYNCDGKTHKAGECNIDGHYSCDGKNHRKGDCGIDGHYVCDGKIHDKAECGVTGHCASDGLNHGKTACGITGHCASDGLNHGKVDCGVTGHCASDGKSHGKADCGVTGHCTSDGKTHEKATCGVAGHYTCDGKTHEKSACGVTGHYICDGNTHDKSACGLSGHYTCDTLDHSKATCGTSGHYKCDGKNHEAAACGVTGHYTCDGKTHSLYECVGEVTLTSPTVAELKDALANYKTINVTNADNISISSADAITVDDAQSLYLNGGTLKVLNGATFTISGTLNIGDGATVNNAGTITGNVSVASGATLVNEGTVTGTVDVAGGGEITNNGTMEGTVNIAENATMTNEGVFGESSTVNNSGIFENINEAFEPTSVTFVNNGKYVDDIARDDLYITITDSANTIILWDKLYTALNYYDGTEKWYSNSTYTLYGSSTEEFMFKNIEAEDISYDEIYDEITLDLNGRTLWLSQALIIQNYDFKFTITDTSEEHTGKITSDYVAAVMLDSSNIELYVKDCTLEINSDMSPTISFAAEHTVVIDNSKIINTNGNAIANTIGTSSQAEIVIKNGGSIYGSRYGISHPYFSEVDNEEVIDTIVTIDGVQKLLRELNDGATKIGNDSVVEGGTSAIGIIAW